MKQTWRWFGPSDDVHLDEIRQAGAEGIVTALHDIAPGETWTRDKVAERRQMIETAGLTWDVVESLPVSEMIRQGKDKDGDHVQAWIASLEALAAENIKVICYNFMPVLDWTRTDLRAEMDSGAKALRFDLTDFAVFDIHILKRSGAQADYPSDVTQKANTRFDAMRDVERDALVSTILAGLPGSAEHWSLESFRKNLTAYSALGKEQLRSNLQAFLQDVVPHAERLGLRLCCHPDDPPWPLLGLPRIMSTEADYRWLLDCVDSPANGITFCSGSLGARPDNDLPGMIERLGHRIHFLHLRNVFREDETIPGSFHEAEHLDGSSDMVAIIAAVLAEEARRREVGSADSVLPMRPDHGQMILDDNSRNTAPGYPAIGRLKGLAELRGVARTLESRGTP